MKGAITGRGAVMFSASANPGGASRSSLRSICRLSSASFATAMIETRSGVIDTLDRGRDSSAFSPKDSARSQPGGGAKSALSSRSVTRASPEIPRTRCRMVSGSLSSGTRPMSEIPSSFFRTSIVNSGARIAAAALTVMSSIRRLASTTVPAALSAAKRTASVSAVPARRTISPSAATSTQSCPDWASVSRISRTAIVSTSTRAHIATPIQPAPAIRIATIWGRTRGRLRVTDMASS